MESEKVSISDLEGQIQRAYDVTETFAFDIRLLGKNALRLRLLAEETLGLATQIVHTAHIRYWLDGDAKECHLNLEAKKKLENQEKQELLSVSTTGENTAYRGVTGKIKSLFLKPEELSSPWTLTDYKKMIQDHEHKDPFEHLNPEDLERSIVASLADEVTVSLHGEDILMVVTKRFS